MYHRYKWCKKKKKRKNEREEKENSEKWLGDRTEKREIPVRIISVVDRCILVAICRQCYKEKVLIGKSSGIFILVAYFLFLNDQIKYDFRLRKLLLEDQQINNFTKLIHLNKERCWKIKHNAMNIVRMVNLNSNSTQWNRNHLNIN